MAIKAICLLIIRYTKSSNCAHNNKAALRTFFLRLCKPSSKGLLHSTPLQLASHVFSFFRAHMHRMCTHGPGCNLRRLLEYPQKTRSFPALASMCSKFYAGIVAPKMHACQDTKIPPWAVCKTCIQNTQYARAL